MSRARHSHRIDTGGFHSPEGFTRPVHTLFSTPAVAPAERFDYWRTWYSEATTSEMRLHPVFGVPPDFASTAEMLQFGELSIAELHCGPALGSWHRATTEQHDLIRVTVVLRAWGAIGHWHHQDVSLADYFPMIYGRTGGWWRAPHGLHTIQINVPRRLLPTRSSLLDRIAEAQPLQQSALFDATIRPMLAGAAGRLGVLANTSADDLATLWLSAVTMLVRSLDGIDLAGVELAPARRLLVERFIEANLHDPLLNPDAVAAALHLSRRTLYQSLGHGARGVAAMIRERRLERARLLLRDPGRRNSTISNIAAEVGIGGPAQFSRLFRAQFGESPRDYRRRVLPTASSTEDARADPTATSECYT